MRALFGALASAALVALLATNPASPAVPLDPCHGPEARRLLCPNLRIGPPSDLYVQTGGRRVLLRATSDVKSRGHGPIELHGTATADYSRQWIPVKGLHGCFAFVMRVDPHGLLFESNEHGNTSRRLARLPFRADTGCRAGRRDVRYKGLRRSLYPGTKASPDRCH